ncbi:MAG: hypothetical protein U1F54_13165 [Burkholderiales bacterium]
MDLLASLFVGRPLNIVFVAVAFAMLSAAMGYLTKGQPRRVRWSWAAAIAWAAYAAWEGWIRVVTPDANIRVDLLLIYPVLAVLSAWALYRALR